MGTISPTLPSKGDPRGTADSRVKGSLVTLRDALNNLLNSENKIPGTSLASNAAIADTQLASPNNSAYRTLLFAQNIAGGISAGTYILGNDGIEPTASGGKLTTGAPKNVHFLYFDDADYTVAGKSQKLRLRAQIAVNGTKPALKFTFGLYPISAAGGGANELTLTLGTVVSGSAAEINEPAANSLANAVGADFAVPSDGLYALGFVTSATLTTNSAVLLSAQLQTHSV